jgi:hypothetical protein
LGRLVAVELQDQKQELQVLILYLAPLHRLAAVVAAVSLERPDLQVEPMEVLGVVTGTQQTHHRVKEIHQAHPRLKVTMVA